MINISVGADEALQRAKKNLAHVKGGFQRAVTSSLNRVIEGMRTDAARETKERYFISAGDVRKTLSLRKAGAGNLSAGLKSRGRRRSLADYKLTSKSPKSGVKNILRGAVKRDGGLKTLNNGFLIRSGGGYRPFYRTGRGRYDFKPFISPAVPQLLKNEAIVQKLQDNAASRFEKRLNHEVLRLIGALP